MLSGRIPSRRSAGGGWSQRELTEVLWHMPSNPWIGSVGRRRHVPPPGGTDDLRCAVDAGVPAPLPQVFEALRHVGACQIMKRHEGVRLGVLHGGCGVEQRMRGLMIAVDENEAPAAPGAGKLIDARGTG